MAAELQDKSLSLEDSSWKLLAGGSLPTKYVGSLANQSLFPSAIVTVSRTMGRNPLNRLSLHNSSKSQLHSEASLSPRSEEEGIFSVWKKLIAQSTLTPIGDFIA